MGSADVIGIMEVVLRFFVIFIMFVGRSKKVNGNSLFVNMYPLQQLLYLLQNRDMFPQTGKTEKIRR